MPSIGCWPESRFLLLKFQRQLIAKENPRPHVPMYGGMLLRGQRLQVVQTVIESVAVNVMQHETRQQNAVFLLVFAAVQRCPTVAEVSVSIAEKRAAVIC
jgi:hypothetical protein